VTGDATVWWWLAAAGVAVLALLGVWILRKGRPFAPGNVFRASRWSSGNRLFPTQVLVTPESVVQYKPKWIGHQEEVIHMAHVASVKIATGLILSDIEIETSGGSDPIRCHGHHKADATRMKALIEQSQSAYYGKRPLPPIT
jgi:LPXTG-motif cell wall-anchored protein